ncbi:MAG: TIGR04282 family arsenosugar biosynthesis glycosyltransferase [Acetobacteraceae bacterium]
MRGDTLVVFARAPRLDAVKRRLAREIGAWAALRFYRACLCGLLRALGGARPWRSLLALTPERARFAAPRGLARVRQGGGDLGARMAAAFAARPRRRLVLIGSDIPGVGAAEVRAAFRALGRASAVFGPALDGGYWLVGMGARRPSRPFAGVRWSSPQALADTLANFPSRRVALLPPRRDVDTLADLAAFGRRASRSGSAGSAGCAPGRNCARASSSSPARCWSQRSGAMRRPWRCGRCWPASRPTLSRWRARPP